MEPRSGKTPNQIKKGATGVAQAIGAATYRGSADAEGGHGVDAGGAAGGEIAGECADGGE